MWRAEHILLEQIYLSMYTENENVIKITDDYTLQQALKDISKKYGTQNVFGRFVSVKKFGVNPNYLYNTTPIGLYGYPLDHLLKKTHNNNTSVAYAGDHRYLYVFKLSPDANIWDLSQPANDSVLQAAVKLGYNVNPKDKTHLYKILKTDFMKIPDVLKMAGVDAMIDNKSIIHSADPVQAWFADTSKLQILAIIDIFSEVSDDSQNVIIDIVMDLMDNTISDDDAAMIMDSTGIQISDNINEVLFKTKEVARYKSRRDTVKAYKSNIDNVVVRSKVSFMSDPEESPTTLSMVMQGSPVDIAALLQKYSDGEISDDDKDVLLNSYIRTKLPAV